MKIKFEHKLPAMNIDGKHNGTYNNYELGMPGILTTKDTNLGEFMHQLRNIILDDRRLVFIDGRIIMCSNKWIRDHVHEMKAFRHWEYDIGSFLNFIIETQREDGQYFELIKQWDDYHWKMVDENCRVMYPEDNQTLVRLELEADIEYLVVEGAMYNFKVTGDLAWLKKVLPALERGIDYITSNSKRWDKERGLVKRPFTIDTWDFCYNPDKSRNKSAHDRRISENTPMSIMHGDNTGVYQAMCQLAFFNRKLGRMGKACEWEKRAGELKKNIFKHLYNGTFFMHECHLGHDGADKKEAERLSLSNAYALNRGIFTTEEARRLIDEYRRRRETTGYFAEWFTIDPPYDDFIGYKAGEYVNGAISPFTAGELAKGAFAVGYEKYGWDILSRFIKMRERDGKIFFLYSPVDCMPQDKQGPSAWGAATLISAVDEGLAGIVDADTGYKKISFSPRFPVTEYTELRYITGYEKTGVKVDVSYILKCEGMRYDITSPAEEINVHILLPEGKQATKTFVNGTETPFYINSIGESMYVDFIIKAEGKVSIEIIF
ncbi:MAG: trehalase family glycosidase [Eubacteriales bacterium]|nr:trehalase family glycosidase [Eubacteriales bacterium]